ncbi:MAG TPA: hypothetical protein ENJ18_03605, partial [Nannocystis exedens]|nr:hypothetical protein [Nannocystis exedens]
MFFATLAFSSILQTAAPSAVDSNQCMATVYEFFNRESYGAAATAAKRCWAKTANPDALFAAALSYQRLDRCAHALIQLRRLSASSSMAEMGDVAKGRITTLVEQCRQSTVETHLRFSPSKDGSPNILRASYLSKTEEPLIIVLGQATGNNDTHTLHLDPGEWQLELQRADDVQTMQISVVAGNQEAPEVFFPDPPEKPEPLPDPELPDNDRPKLQPHTILGLGAVGVTTGLLLGGVTLVVVGKGENQELVTEIRNPPLQTQTPPNNALNGIMHTSQGFAALGAAAGAGAVAITDFFGADRRALIAESAAGGLIATGGLVGLLLTTKSYKKSAIPLDNVPDYLNDHAPKDYATSALLGLGLGMASSAAISLLVTKLRERTNS